jgi:hypothetical protein
VLCHLDQLVAAHVLEALLSPHLDISPLFGVPARATIVVTRGAADLRQAATSLEHQCDE